jgi:hypothetical protein
MALAIEEARQAPKAPERQTEAERKLALVERDLKDLLARVERFEKESGVKVGHAWAHGDIGAAVRTVQSIGLDGHVARAQRVADELRDMSSRIMAIVGPRPEGE